MIVRHKLRDQVIQEILAVIRGGDVEVGQSLPSERELSAKLGVSRTVVREALTALEMQGALTLVPGRRPERAQQFDRAFGETLRLAAEADVRSVHKLLEIRRIIEPEAAALAALRRTDEDLALMATAIERMEQGVRERAGYVRADVEFHDALLVAAGNDLLESMFRAVAELSQRSRDLTAWRRRTPLDAAAEHRAILAAVSAGDAGGARSAMVQHLASTVADLEAFDSSEPTSPTKELTT